jgi:hypothetical protein
MPLAANVSFVFLGDTCSTSTNRLVIFECQGIVSFIQFVMRERD